MAGVASVGGFMLASRTSVPREVGTGEVGAPEAGIMQVGSRAPRACPAGPCSTSPPDAAPWPDAPFAASGGPLVPEQVFKAGGNHYGDDPGVTWKFRV